MKTKPAADRTASSIDDLPNSPALEGVGFKVTQQDLMDLRADRPQRKRSKENQIRLQADLSDSQLLQRLSSQLVHEEKVEVLYEKLLDAATTIMESQFASMQMLDPERGNGGELRLLAFRGFSAEAATFWEWVRPDSECTCGAALRTGQRVIVPDVEQCELMAGTEDLATYRQTGIRAVQTTPLLSRSGKVVGMISTHWSSPYQPTERDLRLLDVIVRQAADLIDRSQVGGKLAQASAESDKWRRLYETVLANTPDLGCVFDLNHRFTYANDALLATWGRTWDEAIGKNCLELGYEPWHAAMHDREIDQVIATKKPVRGEVPFKGSNGRRIYDYIFFPVFGSNGEVEAVAGSTRDVTERKLSEEALRNELILRRKTETLVAGEKQVLELIASGAPLQDALELLARIIEQRFSDQGALTSVLLLEKDGKHLRHGAAPSLPDAYNQVIDGIEIGPSVGSCGTAAFRGQRVIVTDIATDPLWKDFSSLALTHDLRACWSTPLVAYGKILGTFAIYYRQPQNPTNEELEVLDRASRTAAVAIEHASIEQERKAASEAHSRLAAIVNTSDDAIISKDLNGIIMTWNRGAERIFGYTAEEVIGKPVTILMPPDRVDDEPGILERIRNGESIDHYDTVRRRKDGTLLNVSLTVSPITGPDGRIIGASKIARDITQRKSAEHALRQAEKLAAVGRLAATVAHEINNPLAAVTNLVWLLRHDPSIPENARAYLKTADEELSRVAHLTKQTLGFYRGNSSPQRFRVAELIEDLLALFGPRLRNKNLHMDSIVDPALEITSVSGELRQVLTNLVSNSIDAVASGGRIWVRARAASRKVRRGVRILLADNGHGISDSHRNKIFQPFFSTKEDVGTGLGLWVVHEIINKNRGSIHLRTSTRPGYSGTAFSIFIPDLTSAEVQPATKTDVKAAS
ncbi:MAG TPA: PAS domain S-box protein [Terriglobales bacterium]|nr:PAS domain S-box protein [Terriglobales bacterium]